MKKKSLQSLVDSTKEHWLISLVVAGFALASGFQAVTWAYDAVDGYWRNNFAWKSTEEVVLNSLSTNMQLGYITQTLGEPIFQTGGEVYREYVFRRKEGYMQVVVDRFDSVQLISYVICGSDFSPTLKMPESKQLVIGKTTLAQYGKGNPYYFVSGATGPSYAIEEYPSSNLSNYQTVYVGNTDSCGYSEAEKYYNAMGYSKQMELAEYGGKYREGGILSQAYYEGCCYDQTDPGIDQMRRELTINTVAILAPGVEDVYALRKNFQIGPSRLDLRVLPGFYVEPNTNHTQEARR